MLERLRKYLEDVEDDEVLHLGSSLLAQLDSYPRRTSPNTIPTI